MDEKGNPIVIQEGAGENGADKEIGLDAIHLYSKVPALQDEAKGHRLSAKALKELIDIAKEAGVDTENLESFRDWVESATTSIETVKNFDDKKLIDAKDVEGIKKAAIEAQAKELAKAEAIHKKQFDKATITITDLQNAMFDLMIGDRFSNSKFVKDKLNMPAKVAKAYFGQNFKVEKAEDGKYQVISYQNGEKLFSEVRLGESPDFDEALGLMVAHDPDRDSLLTGAGAGGSGAGTGTGNGDDGKGDSNPWVKGPNYNLTKQGEIHKQDSAMAAKLKAEADVINANASSKGF